MFSVAIIRSQVERRIPGDLTVYERRTPDVFPTGIATVDREEGGIPKGALTQLCAPAGVTSGPNNVAAVASRPSHRRRLALVRQARICWNRYPFRNFSSQGTVHIWGKENTRANGKLRKVSLGQ
jgi:hypothetical protein